MGAPRFDVFLGKNNRFQWRLMGPDDKPVLTSEGFTNKDDAFKAICQVKENAAANERYEKKEDNGKPKFVLKSASHVVLATSDLYEKPEDRDAAIGIVKKAGEAVVMDKTAGL